MRSRITPVILMICLLMSPVATFAQGGSNGASAGSISDGLTKEEHLLASSAVISPNDVARVKRLLAESRGVGDAQLVSRAQLLLALFTERESSQATDDAHKQAIAAEVRSIGSYRWHRTKDVIVKTGLWTGLSALGVVGAAQAARGWATDLYLQTSSASAAAPYLITGEVSRVATIVGTAAAVGGLGVAWLLSINPFDIPAPQTIGSPPRYPRTGMTTGDKIAYLKGVRKDEQKRQARAVKVRTISFALLAAGLTGVLATGISGYLGNLEYTRSTIAPTPADAASYQKTAQIYQYITIGSGSLAFLGLSGATVGYLFGPDPGSLASSIEALDNELATLEADQQQ